MEPHMRCSRTFAVGLPAAFRPCLRPFLGCQGRKKFKAVGLGLAAAGLGAAAAGGGSGLLR